MMADPGRLIRRASDSRSILGGTRLGPFNRMTRCRKVCRWRARIRLWPNGLQAIRVGCRQIGRRGRGRLIRWASGRRWVLGGMRPRGVTLWRRVCGDRVRRWLRPSGIQAIRVDIPPPWMRVGCLRWVELADSSGVVSMIRMMRMLSPLGRPVGR